MDIKVTMTDENGEIVDEMQVYQDGSDCEGVASIRDWLELCFTVEKADEEDEECAYCLIEEDCGIHEPHDCDNADTTQAEDDRSRAADMTEELR